jgi:formate-dependent nitrite reductase membrane component NrfD
MLGAMPARPFWNSPILAALFLISALSIGVATIIMVCALFQHKIKDPAIRADFENSNYLLLTSDVLLLGGELLIIFLFLMFAQLTIGDVRYAVAAILPGGDLAMAFWVLVVIFGLLVPFFIELIQVIPKLLYGGKYRTIMALEVAVPIAILIGGFALRYIIVVAGQITAPAAL